VRYSRSVTGTPAALRSWKKATNMAQTCAIAPGGQDRIVAFSHLGPSIAFRTGPASIQAASATEWRAPGLQWPDIRALAGRAQTCFAAGKHREKRPWGDGLQSWRH
jgi:hypothetical protein